MTKPNNSNQGNGKVPLREVYLQARSPDKIIYMTEEVVRETARLVAQCFKIGFQQALEEVKKVSEGQRVALGKFYPEIAEAKASHYTKIFSDINGGPSAFGFTWDNPNPSIPNLPILHSPSGYYLDEDTPDYSEKPEKHMLVLEKMANSSLDPIADLLAREFGWSAQAAKHILGKISVGSFINVMSKTTFEVCEARGIKAHERKKELESRYPELKNFEFGLYPESSLRHP